MHLGRHIGALLTLLALQGGAQELAPRTGAPVATAQRPAGPGELTNRVAAPSLAGQRPLTNVAVEVISQLRGVSAAAVALTSRGSAVGPFEIDIRTARNPRLEALELSKALGSAAAVIFEQRSAKGDFKTNRTYRAGRETVSTAPADGPLKGGLTQRLYVWPELHMAPPPLKPRLIISETTTNR